MNQYEQLKKLMEYIETKKDSIELLNVQLQELSNDENVKKYISLVEQRDKSSNMVDKLKSQISRIEKDECHEYGHRVLLCTGINRDYFEERDYYCCECLNCGEKLEILKRNMQASRIIDVRTYIKKTSNILKMSISSTMVVVLEQAEKEYHLLRDCYYKYPEILKETDKKDKMIYKVMRKRYEAK